MQLDRPAYNLRGGTFAGVGLGMVPWRLSSHEAGLSWEGASLAQLLRWTSKVQPNPSPYEHLPQSEDQRRHMLIGLDSSNEASSICQSTDYVQ